MQPATNSHCWYILLLFLNQWSLLLVSGVPEYSSGGVELVYSINCESGVDSHCEAPTLYNIANNLTSDSFERTLQPVIIEINVSQLQLTERVEFRHVGSLSVTGTNTTITCTATDSGLVFSNISRLIIDNITLMDCGTRAAGGMCSSTTAALTLYQCGDISISNLLVTKSRGIGLRVADHQGGTVQVVSSNFTESRASVQHDPKCGEVQSGGGVYIGDFQQDPLTSAVYHFQNCFFSKNILSTNFSYNSTLANTDELRREQGGGVLLVFENGLTDMHVVFSQCTFSENYAILGGGLSVEIEGGRDKKSENITITVRDSLFEENGCGPIKSAHSGGGANFNFDMFSKSNLTSSRIALQNVNFTKNCAQLGGGVYFNSGHELESSNDLNTLVIDSCTFNGNKGYTGSAIGLAPSVFDRSSHILLLMPVFKDCTFLSNIPMHNDDEQVSHSRGTVYSNLFNIKFEGHNHFRNNLETALYIVNGRADFSDSNADIVNNTGLEGGGVALIGLSSFIVGRNKSYAFVNNTAISRGGAIFSFTIDGHDYAESMSCFIRHGDSHDHTGILPVDEWNTSITFIGNRANGGTGHAIFATSLHSCQVVNGNIKGERLYMLVSTPDVFTVRGMKFDDNQLLQPQIATEGALLNHDDNVTNVLEVVPGEQYKHGVTLSDDLNNTVKLTLRASVKDNLAVALDPAFSSCLSDEIALRGEPGQTANLLLQTLPPRQTSLELQIKLVDCHPGFTLSEDNECICDPRPYIGLRCDANRFYSYLSPGFWAGLVYNGNRTVLATGTAPSGFCDYNGTEEESLGVRLPRNISDLDEAICGKSKTGILCGNCRQGYTTYFHSPDFLCKPADPTLCKVGWLFYIISELVPVTVMFITVLALNISFTSGAINGFIFFVQLLDSLNVDAFGIITYPTAISVLAQGYQVIYGFFNLDFFNIEVLSFCLWPNATALDMLVFKYVTIVYALFLVVIVVLVTNKCGGRYLGKCCRITKLKTSVIHGISTFLVICYAQCVKVSLTLLQGYQYALQRGNRMNLPTVVFLNANLPYFTGRHLIYALPALLFLLIIGVIPPMCLLIYPLLNKVLALCGIEDSKPVNFISKLLPISSLKPLLDSFQGCFKDNLRFFAGLYFIYRWIPFIIDASTYSNSTFFLILGIILVCILALHAVIQPYSMRTHNIVDNLLLFDLIVINAVSFGNYYRSRNYGQRRQGDTDAWSAVQLVLIYLPVLVLVVYVLILACSYLLKRRDEKQLSDNPDSRKGYKLKQIVRGFSSPDGMTDDINKEELPHRLVSPNEVEYNDYDRGAALRHPN